MQGVITNTLNNTFTSTFNSVGGKLQFSLHSPSIAKGLGASLGMSNCSFVNSIYGFCCKNEDRVYFPTLGLYILNKYLIFDDFLIVTSQKPHCNHIYLTVLFCISP